MPWTKTNYPASMKKLPDAVRTKAIQIANAMLKEKKKMNEGTLIATSIKHAKDFLSKGDKKTNVAAKKKSSVKRKVKPVSTVKTKKVSVRKTKTVARSKAKKAVATKAKTAGAGKTKIAAAKKAKSISRSKAKSSAGKEITKPVRKSANSPVTEETLRETITHGENLHFIPEPGGLHMVTPLQSHQLERVLHHREEVALHQENQKVNAALATRKNFKRFNRQTGRR